MKPLTALLAILTIGVVRAQPVSDVKLYLNGQDMGPSTAYLSAGTLMLPLTAFATMGWKPLLDTDNGIIDLAGCLRISLNRPKVWLIGSPPTLGVHSASALTTLPQKAQLRGGRWYLPARAVTGQLLYNVTFDKANLRVNLNKPTDPLNINPNVEACLANVTK